MKSKLLLILICFLLLMNSASALIMYFPPEANWQIGYWDATSTSSATITDTQMEFDIEGGGGDGDEIYYVTTLPIDLRNISHIDINWRGTFGAVDSACVLGIDPIQMTKAFTLNTTKTSTFSLTTTSLNVSNYNNDYYIKIGGYTSSVGLADDINIYVYSIIFYNYTITFPLNATLVEMTSATLHGYINDGSNISTCGFWVSNQTGVNASNYQHNIDLSGPYEVGDTFSSPISGLTSAEYYYCRTWTYDGFIANWSSNESTFLTKPNTPTGFAVSGTHARSIDLLWTNATIPSAANHSVLIHYSTSAPTGSPTPGTWGTFGKNESSLSTTTIIGLAEDTEYHFVAWTYANNSGSPSIGKFSSFTTASDSTSGGIYNISVRYENESIVGNLLVNLSRGCKHKLMIHFEDETDWVTFCNGAIESTVDGYFGNINNGNFTVTVNKSILFLEFRWNDTVGVPYRCNRILIPSIGQRDVTFYIRTDLHIYGESTTKEIHSDSGAVTDPTVDLIITTTHDLDEIYSVSIYNISSSYGTWETVPNGNYTISGNTITISSDVINPNITMGKVDYYTFVIVTSTSDPINPSLISYTFYFKDNTPQGYFESAGEFDAWAEFYWFNGTGIKLTIHKEYWSSNGFVYPLLVFEKKYRVGVGCSLITIPLIGNAPTSSDLSPDPITIPDPGNITYEFFMVIDLAVGWNGPGNGFFVYYQDTAYKTNSVTFHVWDINGTMVYNETSNSDWHNFTYAAAHDKYKYNFTITTDHSYWTTNQTIQSPMNPGVAPITDVTSLDNLITKMFGHSPFVDYDSGTGYMVPWSQVLVAIIAVIMLMSLGYMNSYVGVIGSGMVLCGGFGFIDGIPVHFLLVGVFMISMAFIFALGGKLK